MKAVKNKYPGGGKMKRQMMMEMGGKMKKKRPMYQEGGEIKSQLATISRLERRCWRSRLCSSRRDPSPRDAIAKSEASQRQEIIRILRYSRVVLEKS